MKMILGLTSEESAPLSIINSRAKVGSRVNFARCLVCSVMVNARNFLFYSIPFKGKYRTKVFQSLRKPSADSLF